MSRTKNSIVNIIFSFGGQLVDLVARFILRTVFIYTLGSEYLGLSGLFGNILALLSLADMGIGVAITFSLYKPLEENDEHALRILMKVFKKTYIYIGSAVLLIGVALTPFLNFFIKEMPSDVPHIHLIYVLFVVNTAISYFYSYKTSYVIANQKGYVVTNNRYLMNLLCAIAQAIELVVIGNYILFLIIQIVFTIASNVRISFTADKMYPILKEHTNEHLDEDTKNTIVTNVKALIIQRVGSEVVFSTDNLLLSKIFGLVIVGVYSNYTLVINALEAILSQFFQAITASVGNLGVNSDKQHQKDIFYVVLFINFWMYAFSAIALGVLFQPFITLWIGEKYLMTTGCLFFIVINFYLKGMRQSVVTFNNAYGMMRHYKYAPIFECVANIGASILFAKMWGPIGIFIGTTLSTALVPLWAEPRALFKHGLDGGLPGFFVKYFVYGVFASFAFVITMLVANAVSIGGIFGFILRMFIVALLPNIMILVAFFRTKEFNYLKDTAMSILKKQ